jgi:7,8-dihydropterin-6-yl-methyl-4-(beta-D-ribofuranosyl)aminobenzene 5'-phosphate synthase
LGNARHILLFDAGPEAYAIGRNGDRLKIVFADVGAVVLSHGHWDHAGGLVEAIGKIVSSNGGKPVPCHVNQGMFQSRAIRLPDGGYIPFQDIPSVQALTSAGAAVINSPESRLLLGDLFYLSGEIPRVTAYKRGLASHMKRSEDGGRWEPDPWIMDERYLAAHVTSPQRRTLRQVRTSMAVCPFDVISNATPDKCVPHAARHLRPGTPTPPGSPTLTLFER